MKRRHQRRQLGLVSQGLDIDVNLVLRYMPKRIPQVAKNTLNLKAMMLIMLLDNSGSPLPAQFWPNTIEHIFPEPVGRSTNLWIYKMQESGTIFLYYAAGELSVISISLSSFRWAFSAESARNTHFFTKPLPLTLSISPFPLFQIRHCVACNRLATVAEQFEGPAKN